MGITLPAITDITDEKILLAREDLKDQLIPFRNSMLSLAPLLRSGIENDDSL